MGVILGLRGLAGWLEFHEVEEDDLLGIRRHYWHDKSDG
jgi:hypothetical protein